VAEGTVSGNWKQTLVRWGGLALLAASLIYLAKALAKLDFARLVAAMDWREWLLSAVLALVYAAALGLLAKGWSAMAAPGRKLSLAQVLGVYGPGAVAKYVPGSVLQYASRQVMGKRVEMEHSAMARASLAEAALHIGIALALAGALLAGTGWWAAGVAGLSGIVLTQRPSRSLIACLGWQLMFFAIFAALVIVLGSFGALAGDPGRLAGYFFVAWVAGFLVPVAPGGIGVREAVLLAVAARAEGADAAALLALLARLVGIVGDGLFGLAGYVAAARLSNRQAS
jgi:hypothetical protein